MKLSAQVRLAAVALCGSTLWSPVVSGQTDRVAFPTVAGTAAQEVPIEPPSSAITKETLPRGQVLDFGNAPPTPEGPLAKGIGQALQLALGGDLRGDIWGAEQKAALQRIASSKDPRLGWIVSDLMRVTTSYERMEQLAAAASKLLGIELNPRSPWGRTTDHLIAWDTPDFPGYLEVKRRIYTTIVPEWERLLVEGDVDWRHVSWGGVLIDKRPFGTTDDPCNCIPAADNPGVSDVAGAEWLADDAVVFGIEVNGEFRAYPRRIMEVREMVNDTLGGRHLGIPYCTLCGSAQAYFTDRMPEGIERPVLRTSGLLLRSNKVMFDLNTYSVFDTFRGYAATGPLAELGIVLPQAGVVTTTWGQWKSAHPETSVLVESLALGRDFDLRNSRDANGPIFPIGDVDPRLPVLEDVLGIVTESGRAIAFHGASALAALARGESVNIENVHVVLNAGGLRAVDKQGLDLGGHLAFWFAWSQFYPETELWPF